jgi:hypothetical protein
VTKEKTTQRDDQTAVPRQKLLVSGWLHLKQRRDLVELKRGMFIVAQDGVAAGAIAAVAMECRSQKVSHILLGYVPPTAIYRLVPLKLIDHIDGETVWLRLFIEDIENLPIYQPN